jgi:release factor glutamine methyltransferase
MTTIHERVAAARQQLREAGISLDEADLDARLLAEHILGWDATEFFTSANGPEPEEFQTAYGRLVERRTRREPLAYITRRQAFWDLVFEVSPAVLIPRPESELIVEAALELYPSSEGVLAIADVCTGSGCLAVALARERSAARVIATDISGAALDVARRNAERHGVADRIEFVRGDLVDPVADPVDLIVCNPPYVNDGDRLGLQPEVRDHEPAIALFGGSDGLHVITRLVDGAPTRLRPGGHLIFEFGFGQDEAIETLIGNARGLRMLGLRRDLQGIARTAVAERRSSGEG